MPLSRFVGRLDTELAELRRGGTAKGAESVIVGVVEPSGELGPRYLLEGEGERLFLRMNANAYLGLSRRAELVEAEEEGARRYGVGPGAVRFISGTYAPHRQLERALAEFHQRGDCMITSAAYTAMMGVIVTLTRPDTVIVSDELNHNCIINAMKLARPLGKKIYPHLDMEALERAVAESVGEADNLLVVTDGVFSMRGDLAPLAEIQEIIARHNASFAGDIVLIVDDSHGVGAFGPTGRGTEEHAGGVPADVLVGTLGKAFGVNGGYIVSHATLIHYLRERNPFYIYTNPITPSEATAALRSVELVDSEEGRGLLAHLGAMTRRFEEGIVAIGYETIPSAHPVVPVVVRDTERTARLVTHLRQHGILATGLNFPVVPKGEELIRFQLCAEHTPADIDYALEVLRAFRAQEAG